MSDLTHNTEEDTDSDNNEICTKGVTLVSFGYKYGPPGDTIYNFNIQSKVYLLVVE